MANAKGANTKNTKADETIAVEKAENEKLELVVQGITIHVWGDMLDDLELLEDLISLEEGNNRASISALKRVLGEEYELVKDALRDERGIVKTKDVGAFFFAVLDEVKAKNF